MRKSERIGLGSALVNLCVFALFMTIPVLGKTQEQSVPAEEVREETETLPNKDMATDLGITRVIRLEDARRLVRENGLDVQLARTQVTIAESGIRQSWSALHPQIAGSGSYTIHQEEISFSPTPEAPPIVVQPRNDYRWAISASVRADFRTIPRIRQAYAERDLAKAQVDVTRESLDQTIINIYYNLLNARQLIDLAAQQLESNRTMLRATELRRRAETATEFEVTRASLRVVQAEKNLERARLQFVEIRAQVAELLQTPADFDVESPPTPPKPADLQSLKDQAQKNQAMIQANSLQHVVAERALQEVFWQYAPVFNATFTYAGTKGSLLNPGSPRWMLSFGAEWTFWDGGVRGAQAAQRRAQLLAVEIQQRQTLAKISSEIEQAWAQYLAAQSQVESSIQEVQLARISLEQAEKGYEFGVSSQLDVINAQEQFELARISQIQERLALELAAQRLRIMATPMHD